MDNNAVRAAGRQPGQVTAAIRKIEEAFIQLRDEVITLEEAIAPALKPESSTLGSEGPADTPECSAITNELDMHLARLRGLRNRVADIISRVDI